MKKYLLSEGHRYKANLHTHTNVSDGRHSPEEVKAFYKSHGYSIVAFTDHECLVDQSRLNDEDFLAITGYEYGLDERGKPWKFTKTCHLCLLAREPDNVTHVCFNPKKTLRFSEDFHKTAKYRGEIFEGSYSVENLNLIISEAKKQGFFVTVNHPWWSLMEVDELVALEGFDGFEIYNTASGAGDSYYDFHPYLYELLLRKGKKCIPIAADDLHTIVSEDKHQPHGLGGFNVIAADSLDYSDVFAAIERGDLYSSTGPIINSIFCEDGNITVECEDAQCIMFRTASRRGYALYADPGKTVTTATFPMVEDDLFVYAMVKNFKGEWAVTRAYTAEEILK